jgi:hypothetical protein
MGIHGLLSDLARSGRPALMTQDLKAWVKNQAHIKPKESGYEQEL